MVNNLVKRKTYEGSDVGHVIHGTADVLYSGPRTDLQLEFTKLPNAEFQEWAKENPPRASITATQGPLHVLTEERIDNQIASGMTVARINCSHAEGITEMVERLRAGEERSGKPLGIMLDTKGPEVRIMSLPKKDGKGENFEILMKEGEETTLTIDDVNYENDVRGKSLDKMRIGVNYPEFLQDVEPGQLLPIEGGANGQLEIVSIEENDVKVKAIGAVKITNKRHLNFPERNVSQPTIGEKDKKDIEEGLLAGIDEISLSFVRNAQDIQDLKDFIDDVFRRHPNKKQNKIHITAKIENLEGIKNIEEIVEASDGIMICRGDLAAETGHDKSALWQRVIPAISKHKGKSIILATEAFESFVMQGGEGVHRQTAAEYSDLWRIVGKYHPRLMLSGETGDPDIPNPEKAVSVLQETAHKAEFYSSWLRKKTRQTLESKDSRGHYHSLRQVRALERNIANDLYSDSNELSHTDAHENLLSEIGLDGSTLKDLLPEITRLYIGPWVSSEIVDAITFQGRAIEVVRIAEDDNRLRRSHLRNAMQNVRGKVDNVVGELVEKETKPFGVITGKNADLKLDIYASEDHVFHSADIPNAA